MDIELFESKMRVIADGGVASATGVTACGIHAGFTDDPNRLDLALVMADAPVPCAGMFTRNRFCAAPVTVSRAHLGQAGCGRVQAVMVNAGNANAATGQAGVAVASEACDIAAQIIGCEPAEVLAAATGVIGVPPGIDRFEIGLPAAVDACSSAGGSDAARAIMTGDSHPKQFALTYDSQVLEYVDCSFTVGGMCKGSGLVMPNMATMIAVLTTDAPIGEQALRAALGACVERTFNKVTVDSGSSTNDTCLLLATGAAGVDVPPIEEGTPAFEEFTHALRVVCESLARSIALDSAGGSRLVTVNVTGAATDADADAAARAVATSPRVHEALMARAGDWGLVASVLGMSGAAFEQAGVSIDIMGVPLCRAGVAVPFDAEELARRIEGPELVVSADLGAGSCATTMWTCEAMPPRR